MEKNNKMIDITDVYATVIKNETVLEVILQTQADILSKLTNTDAREIETELWDKVKKQFDEKTESIKNEMNDPTPIKRAKIYY